MLTLICGLPRAGKTTYSTKMQNVIHLDDYNYLPPPINYRKCATLAETCEDIVIEGVFGKAEYRKALAESYKGQHTKCVWMDTPDEVRRLREGWCRGCDQPFEPPTYDEGWDEIVVIRGDSDGI